MEIVVCEASIQVAKKLSAETHQAAVGAGLRVYCLWMLRTIQTSGESHQRKGLGEHQRQLRK